MTTSIEEMNELFQSRVRWSNIPIATFKTHRLWNFIGRKGAKEAYQAALDFVSSKARHPFFAIFGEPGTGKTHLALGIGWLWLENNYGLVKYWQVESLLGDLRRGFSADTDEKLYNFDQLLKQIKEVPLLILDDLGVEQSTPWARAKLDEIVDHRYLNQLQTIITTNLTLEQLEPRIASRLSEGVIALLECEDFRKTKAQRR